MTVYFTKTEREKLNKMAGKEVMSLGPFIRRHVVTSLGLGPAN